MRCKEHFAADLGTVDGVCPTCLRERLLFVIEAQTRANLETKLSRKIRKASSDGSSPEQFESPRCVSPCRKTENAAVQTLHEQRFHSTPQVVISKKQNKFSNFFRSKSIDINFDSNPSVTASPWSISSMFPIKHKKKKKKSCIFTLTDPNASRVMQRPCRGMSPAEQSDGESNSPETSSKETPSIASTPMHIRCKRMNQARNITGFAFCLSPLVRSSPNLNRNQKGLAPETGISGDLRVPVKPHIGMAASFCANRSKKLASCGRFHPNF